MADHQEPESGAGERSGAVEDEIHAEDLLIQEKPIEPVRPWWFWALVLLGVIVVVYGIGQAIYSFALYDQLRDKDAIIADQRVQLEAFSAINACRSQIAADDAVAQSNKQITSQRVIEVGIAAVLARSGDITPEQKALYEEAAARFNDVFIADIEASRVRFDAATRRANVVELCQDGTVPETQVHPLPVDPVIDIPEWSAPPDESEALPGEPTQPSSNPARSTEPEGNAVGAVAAPPVPVVPMPTAPPPPLPAPPTTATPSPPPVTTTPPTPPPTTPPQSGLVGTLIGTVDDLVGDLLDGLL